MTEQFTSPLRLVFGRHNKDLGTHFIGVPSAQWPIFPDKPEKKEPEQPPPTNN